MLAIGLIAAGALLLWGDSEKDDQGYLSTGKDRYAASTYALASDNLDIDLDGAGWIMDRDDLGKVRLEVDSSAGKPVFVGIARTAHGSGTQTVAWVLEDGDWSIVVMNADGSRGVDTQISAGAKIPFLGTLGWVSLGGALVLLITAGTLMYLGIRTPRPPKAQNVTLQPTPGASASA